MDGRRRLLTLARPNQRSLCVVSLDQDDGGRSFSTTNQSGSFSPVIAGRFVFSLQFFFPPEPNKKKKLWEEFFFEFQRSWPGIMADKSVVASASVLFLVLLRCAAAAPRLRPPPTLRPPPRMESNSNNEEQMRSSDNADRCSCCAIRSTKQQSALDLPRVNQKPTLFSRFFCLSRDILDGGKCANKIRREKEIRN